MIPFTHPAKKNLPGWQWEHEHGVVLHGTVMGLSSRRLTFNALFYLLIISVVMNDEMKGNNSREHLHIPIHYITSFILHLESMIVSVTALCLQVLLNSVICSKLKFDYQKFLKDSNKRDELSNIKNIRLYTPHPPTVLVGKNSARRGD